MAKNVNISFTEEEFYEAKRKKGALSWKEFILSDDKEKLSLQENISLQQVRQEIKDHIEVPQAKNFSHQDVVDDVRLHLLAHMENKHFEHQTRHDEQEQKIQSLAQAIHKITHIMPNLNNDVPNTTMHKIKNKTDILTLVESCAIKR